MKLTWIIGRGPGIPARCVTIEQRVDGFHAQIRDHIVDPVTHASHPSDQFELDLGPFPTEGEASAAGRDSILSAL